MSVTSLTSTEQKVYSQLQQSPKTYPELANALEVSISTARDHLSSLKASGVSVKVNNSGSNRKEFYLADEVDEHPINTDEIRYTTSSKKREQTKETNNHLQSLERRLKRILNNSEPAIADGGHGVTESNEDVVIHVTDDHIGSEIKDEFNNVVFNPEIAVDRRVETFDTCFDLVERQQSAGYEFDTLNLLMGGDIVDGEVVYEHQPHEIAFTLDKQLDTASELYMEQIRRAASKFDSVRVVCQSGNHGELQASGSSETANADRIFYMMLDKMVRQSELDNVTFIRNSATGFTNVEIRGHRMHLRHGDESLEHIGTSSGKRRWFQWRNYHQFDQAYRGHYHKFEIDTLTRTEITESGENSIQPQLETENVKVIMTGSPKPPADFEEAIAAWSQPSATIHGVSDDRPMTWFFPVDFDN